MKTKRFTIFGLLLLIGITVFSQVSVIPQGFNYQAIARDSIGSPRANQTINLRFTITNQTGTNIPYIETQSKMTDQFGLFTAIIGQGTQTGGTGTFSQIDWKTYNYYVKTEIQEGLNYFVIGTEPLLTVPYAMVAKEAVYAVPPGTVVPFCGANIPSGWLLCNGDLYTVTQYPELYTAIEITFGGSLGANFNVPDFRGMFLRGAGTNGSKQKAAGGNFTGGNLGDYEQDQFQGHLLGGSVSGEQVGTGTTNAAALTFGGTTQSFQTHIGNQGLINDANNGTPRIGNETKPASFSVNYIIKY